MGREASRALSEGLSRRKELALFMAGCVFEDGVRLDARFPGPATFYGSRFEGRASFGGGVPALFLGPVSFSGARFEGPSSFREVHFSSDSLFRGTRFLGEADFKRVYFGGVADFTGAEFWGEAVFTRARFSDVGLMVGLRVGEGLKLCRVAVDREGGLLLDGLSMERVYLLGTDGRRLSIGSVEWEVRGGRVVLPEESMLGRALDHEEDWSVITREKVGLLFRTLRVNLERQLRFEEAGMLFVGEMEMRRLSMGPVGRVISPLALYKWMSNYGESASRPALWSVLAVLLFGLARAASRGGVWALPSSMAESLLAFLQMGPESPDLLAMAERSLSVLLLGQVFVALRRRLERRAPP